jgi:hypothetical protein
VSSLKIIKPPPDSFGHVFTIRFDQELLVVALLLKATIFKYNIHYRSLFDILLTYRVNFILNYFFRKGALKTL